MISVTFSFCYTATQKREREAENAEEKMQTRGTTNPALQAIS